LNSMTDREKIEARARALGFCAVGFARATVLEEEQLHLEEWLGRGFQASMAWMDRTAGTRTDPRRYLPGARTVISLAMNYYSPEEHGGEKGRGKISRYAWGDDYHDLIGIRLADLGEWLEGEYPGEKTRWAVDSRPVMEKAWAVRAGIGWLGKHTNVITRSHGSWIFLGEILTTLEVDPDPPAIDHCGSCTRCIEACPTAAIVEPYLVDSRLCLSYLTIEHRGPVPGDIRDRYERWIFGCDICQDVCPWNHKFSCETSEPGLRPRDGFVDPVLEEWRILTTDELRERVRGSPVGRAKYDGLMRNIDIVMEAGTKTDDGASHGHDKSRKAPGETDR